MGLPRWMNSGAGLGLRLCGGPFLVWLLLVHLPQVASGRIYYPYDVYLGAEGVLSSQDNSTTEVIAGLPLCLRGCVKGYLGTPNDVLNYSNPFKVGVSRRSANKTSYTNVQCTPTGIFFPE
jgi:hypothetical protein